MISLIANKAQQLSLFLHWLLYSLCAIHSAKYTNGEWAVNNLLPTLQNCHWMWLFVDEIILHCRLFTMIKLSFFFLTMLCICCYGALSVWRVQLSLIAGWEGERELSLNKRPELLHCPVRIAHIYIEMSQLAGWQGQRVLTHTWVKHLSFKTTRDFLQ